VGDLRPAGYLYIYPDIILDVPGDASDAPCPDRPVRGWHMSADKPRLPSQTKQRSIALIACETTSMKFTSVGISG
jgi:hypothetical protein